MRSAVVVVALVVGGTRAAGAQPEPVVIEPPAPVVIEPPAPSPPHEPPQDRLRVLVYASAGTGGGKRIYHGLPLQQNCAAARPHVEYDSGRLGGGAGFRWTLKRRLEAQIRGTLSTFGVGQVFKELCNSREPPYTVEVSALQLEVEGTMRLRADALEAYLGIGPRIGYLLGSGRAVSATREVDAGFAQPIAGLLGEAGYLFGADEQLDVGIRLGFLWAGEVTQVDLLLAVGYAIR